MKRMFILLLLSALSIACDDDVESNDRYLQIDGVTGLDLFDANGSPLGRLGIPNDKKGDVQVFPVPTGSELFINVETSHFDKVYTIKSTCDDEIIPEDIADLMQSVSYTVEQLEAAAGVNMANVYSLPGESRQLTLDLTNKDPGFYKVYVLKDNGELLWYNTYIDPSVENYEDFSFYELGCL